MAILRGVETREMLDPMRSPSMFAMPVHCIGDSLDVMEPAYDPTISKTAFTFRIRIPRDPLEARDHRRNHNEDSWLHRKIHDQLELEDEKGRLVPLDDIFLERHNLPTGLRHREQIRYHPDDILYYLQSRNYTMYANMGNPEYSQRMKLINPVITRLDRRYERTNFPFLREDTPDYYRGTNLEMIDLEFEILCDSFIEVPNYTSRAIKEVIRETLKKNLTISVLPSRQDILTIQATVAEIKARATLRDMISEKEYRKYITNGFVMVQGDSGRWYQVFNKQKHLRVYDKGKFIKELCIHTAPKECPPTDHVLNMKVMIECDEQTVWDESNLYEPKKKVTKFLQEENNNIVDIFSKLKKDRGFFENKREYQRQQAEDEFFRDYA